jgi:hypothetical protein
VCTLHMTVAGGAKTAIDNSIASASNSKLGEGDLKNVRSLRFVRHNALLFTGWRRTEISDDRAVISSSRSMPDDGDGLMAMARDP